MDSEIELLTPSDVRKILGCGVNQAYNLFHSKGFPSIRINNRWYIRKTSFERWLATYEGKKFTVI